jgi:hypothetical protein
MDVTCLLCQNFNPGQDTRETETTRNAHQIEEKPHTGRSSGRKPRAHATHASHTALRTRWSRGQSGLQASRVVRRSEAKYPCPPFEGNEWRVCALLLGAVKLKVAHTVIYPRNTTQKYTSGWTTGTAVSAQAQRQRPRTGRTRGLVPRR